MTTKKLNRVLSIAVVAFAVAVLLAVSSMAAYSLNADGTVSGLDSEKYYQYANITINTNGNAVEYVNATTLTSSTKVSGLIAIRETNKDATEFSDWSTPLYREGYGIGNILHTTEMVGVKRGNEGKTMDVIDTASVTWSDAALTALPVYNEAKWTGYEIGPSLTLNWGYDPLILGTTDDQGNFSYLEDKTGEDLVAAQIKAKAHLEAIYYSYKYTADEVIPMSRFASFKFSVTPRSGQGCVTTTDIARTKFTLKVITEEGTIEDRVVWKDAGKLANTTHTITYSDFDDVSGYIVGILINPYVVEDASTISLSRSGNVDMNVYHYTDGYKVNLPAAAKPTGLKNEFGTITGLKETVAYQYVKVDINGIDDEAWTDIELGSTEFTPDFVGLVGIRVKAVDGKWNASDPVVVYLPGSGYDNILHTVRANDNNSSTYYKNEKGYPMFNTEKSRLNTADGSVYYDAFTEGIDTYDKVYALNENNIYYLNGDKYYNNVTGELYTGTKTMYQIYKRTPINVPVVKSFGALTDNTVRANVYYTEGVWMGYQINTTFARNYNGTELNLGSTDTPVKATWSKELYSTKTALDALLAAEPLDTDAIAAAQKAYDDALDAANKVHADFYYSYAYLPEEIIPMEDFESFKYTVGNRQTGFLTSGNVRTKFVLVVAEENGEITEKVIYKEISKIVYGANSTPTVMITLDDFDDVSGYIVGMRIYQYAETVEGSVFEANGDGNNNGDYTVTLYADGYKVKKRDLVAAAKPTGLDLVDGVITGLDKNKEYEYTNWSLAGIGETWTSIPAESTSYAPDAVGIIAVRVKGDNMYTDASDYVLFYKEGAKEDREPIGILKDYGKYTSYVVTDGDVWVQGHWTGAEIATNSAFANCGLSTLGGHVTAESAKAYYDAVASGNNAAVTKAANDIIKLANNVKFRYTYDNDEIVPTSDLLKIGFTAFRRMGHARLGTTAAQLTFKVATLDGKITDYVWTEYVNSEDDAITVIPSNIKNWPTDGYVVGFEFRPWTDVKATSIKVVSDGTTFYNTMVTVNFITDEYLLATGEEETQTPVISISANNLITVTNYQEGATYAYSTDGGNSWTAFAGDSFTASKASAEYIVKVMNVYPYEGSAVSNAVTSAPIAVIGTSLILDAQIGVKVYLDVDEEKVRKFSLYTTRVYTAADGTKIRDEEEIGKETSQTAHPYWSTVFEYDKAQDVYSSVYYSAAKDIDNVTFETQLKYWIDPVEEGGDLQGITYGGIDSNLSAKTYIATAKSLAKAGVQEFVEALPTVEALETYVAYADNYFGDKTDAEYVSEALADTVISESTKTGTLVGLSFYGTSLILEENVTIRHYFLVTDAAAYASAGYAEATGTNGNYVYYDITDIAAQDLGTAKELTLKATSGAEFTVSYSAVDYIASMKNDSDVSLKSLVNAMYDYYVEAKAYFTENAQ